MEKALNYAIKIIQAYQNEIENSQKYKPLEDVPNLKDLGFCQGSIFREAIKDITDLIKENK
jgi:hypothetical protein